MTLRHAAAFASLTLPRFADLFSELSRLESEFQLSPNMITSGSSHICVATNSTWESSHGAQGAAGPLSGLGKVN